MRSHRSSRCEPDSGMFLLVPAVAPSPGRVRLPVLTIVVVFVTSRLVAAAFGLYFDAAPIRYAYQLLDVKLLRDDPIRSIFYLHSQPPLFNAFTALILQLPPRVVPTTLMMLWHVAGLATALLLYATMVRLGVRRGLAATFVCVFVLMPETLLVESWFFYSQLEILLVATMLWGLARFASTRRVTDGLLCTGALGALVLLRSSFHPLLMVVLLLVVWRQLRLDVRKLAMVAAVPLLVVATWSVKNVLVFDSWSNSSWLGMNLSYVAHAGITEHQCRELAARHEISRIGCVAAFSAPAAYTARFPKPDRFGVAAIDALFKSTGGPNYNASLYLEVSKQYQRDALEILRRGGVRAVVRAQSAAYIVWAEPGDDLIQLRALRAPIAGYADWFDRFVLLRPVATGWNDPYRFTAESGGFPVGRDALGSISYTLLALFGLALFGGVVGYRRARNGDPVRRCVCSVGLVVVVFATLVGNALDFRENNRFRFEIAPAVVVLGALGLELIWQRAHERRSGDHTPV